MGHIRNREIMNLFRCGKVELARLQRALKRQMQEFYVGQEPLIGALISKVDKDGARRDAVWELVAESDPMCEVLLMGARWGRHLPSNFYSRLEAAKHEMERRLNGPYRLRAKEARIRHATNPVYETSFLDQVVNVDEDDPMEGPAPRNVEDIDEHVINTIELNTRGEREPGLAVAHPTLSATIQEAVERATAALAARISELEDRVLIYVQERDRREEELLEKRLGRMEAVSAQRDADLERMQAELETERLWRKS